MPGNDPFGTATESARKVLGADKAIANQSGALFLWVRAWRRRRALWVPTHGEPRWLQ